MGRKRLVSETTREEREPELTKLLIEALAEGSEPDAVLKAFSKRSLARYIREKNGGE